MPWITKEGRTVDEARDAAIRESRLPIDELDIEVVNEGSKGLFGLGGEDAVVRVRPKSEATDFRAAFSDDITPSDDEELRAQTARAPITDVSYELDEDEQRYEDEAASTSSDEPEEPDDTSLPSEQQEAAAALGLEIVKGILERMEMTPGDVRTRFAGGTVYIEIFGDEMGILIGRNGATLEALQELVRAGIQRRLKTRQAIVVDVESYWDRRRKGTSAGKPRSGNGSESKPSGQGQRKSSGGRRRGGRRRRSGSGGSGAPKPQA